MKLRLIAVAHGPNILVKLASTFFHKVSAAMKDDPRVQRKVEAFYSMSLYVSIKSRGPSRFLPIPDMLHSCVQNCPTAR